MSSSRLGGAPAAATSAEDTTVPPEWSASVEKSFQSMELTYWKYTSDPLRWRYRHGTAVTARHRGTPYRPPGFRQAGPRLAWNRNGRLRTRRARTTGSVSGSPMNAHPPLAVNFSPDFDIPRTHHAVTTAQVRQVFVVRSTCHGADPQAVYSRLPCPVEDN